MTLRERLVKIVTDKGHESNAEQIASVWLKVNDLYNPDWGWDTMPDHLKIHIKRVFTYYLDRVL